MGVFGCWAGSSIHSDGEVMEDRQGHLVFCKIRAIESMVTCHVLPDDHMASPEALTHSDSGVTSCLWRWLVFALALPTRVG